jgi:predicted HicB family RNase H-like nuclease
MPTKDSSILSLRVRNNILRLAETMAKEKGISVHAWVIKLIEKATEGINENR